jgi:hypothetical protein
MYMVLGVWRDGFTKIMTIGEVTAKTTMDMNDERSEPMDKIKKKFTAGERCGSHITAHLQVRFQNEVSN